MSKIKYFLKQSWLLIICSFCFGLLIAVVNAACLDRIEKNKIEKLNSLMSGLMPKAEQFEKAESFTIKTTQGKEFESNIYKAIGSGGVVDGWAFNCQGPGFQDKIELVVSVDKVFARFNGFAILASNETPGFGDRIKNSFYRNQYIGAPAGELQLVKTGNTETIDSKIVAISGATVSSKSVLNIINSNVRQIKAKMIDKGLLSNGK